MDTLKVSDAQRATLRNVADHLLQIYTTLARMRYLDVDWIVTGPHDIAANVADYRSHGLDDSIIYLYSVLPYIDSEFTGQVDFDEGGEFIDFRNPTCLPQSRQPLYSDEPEEAMKPWMTPLSMGGNDGVAVIYSAKTNRIWMRTAAHIGSVDPAIMTGDYDYGDDYESGSDNDNEDDDEENAYSEENGRPATAVLRDINRCFVELKTLPGGGEYSSLMWERTVTKPLYEKHGWPSHEFDGDAFLIDLIRADVQSTVQAASNLSTDLERLQYETKRYEDPAFWKYWEDRITAETDLERQWQARFQLWFEKRTEKTIRTRLRHAAEQGTTIITADEQRLASEMNQLKKQAEQRENHLAKLDAQLSTASVNARLRRKQALMDVDLYNRAYAQAKREAPAGAVAESLKGSQADEASIAEQERQLRREIADDIIQDAKAFLETIPSDIKLAREEIELEVFRNTF